MALIYKLVIKPHGVSVESLHLDPNALVNPKIREFAITLRLRFDIGEYNTFQLVFASCSDLFGIRVFDNNGILQTQRAAPALFGSGESQSGAAAR